MTKEEIEAGIQEIHWHHSIPLPHGVVTPGADNTIPRVPTIGLPEDLSGKTVLDIGAWDGFFSFEAERRGARRVLATDRYAWERPGRDGFEFARKALGSKVEDRQIDLLDMTPENVGTFDVVLLLGVLYHMQEPFTTLERAAQLTREQLIVSTAVDMLWTRRPAAAYYPGREFRGDPTNWWGLNPAAVMGILKTVGFERVELHWLGDRSRTFPGRIIRALRHRVRGRDGFLPMMQQASATFHAWK